MLRKITFLLIAITLIFSACTEEEIVRPSSSNTVTPVVNFSPAQEILFHYSYENSATNVLKGWIIDKKGNIKTYDLSNRTDIPVLPTSSSASTEEIENLAYLASETGIILNLDELRKKYIKIELAANGRIDAFADGTAGEGTTTIVAYDYNADTSGSCGGSSHGEETPYRVVLLESFGEVNKVNTIQSATSLMGWLKELHENENL